MFDFLKRKKKTDAAGTPKPLPSASLKQSLLSLEQRLMFDAAAAATAAEVKSEQVAQDQAEAAVSSEPVAEGTTAASTDSQELLQAIASYTPGESTTEVAFVDPTVPDYQALIAGMGPNVEVVMLDATRDGVEQIAESLAGRSGIDAIHLISHGNSGELQLGAGTLNTESMSGKYANELSTVQQSLSEQADILVYGCDFAEGERGQTAVIRLAELTGADVQASTDETGHISLGGDWEFEVQTGTIETSLAISDDAQMNWAGILGAETVVDQFSERSFENSDGTQSWSSDWSESDAGGHDAKGGDIRVNAGQLRIDTNAVGNAISREVDLSRATNATLTFEYTNRLRGGECIELRVSSDGGTTYRTLDGGVFSNESNTDSGVVKFDLSDSCSANTRIQFTVSGAGKGGGDRLHVDNVQISYDTVPLNEAPTDLSLSANTVAENAVTGTVIGTVSGTDVDTGDAKTYSLTDTADGRFAVNSATGQLTVANGSLLNYESATSHTVTVRVTDSGGQSYDEAFTINVTNVNEAPTITSNGGGAAAAVNVAENQNTVTMVAAMDVDTGTTLTYGIAGGPDAMRFSIDSATGALRFSTAPNFERPSDVGRNNVYDVTVQVSDGQGGTATQSISVRVTDVNEAPRITSNRGGDVASVTIRENSSAVTKVRATDPDRGARITYSVVEGADSALFTINPSTGVLRFSSAPNFEQPTDTDRNNVYQVVVQASDGRGGTDSQMISVRVANVNEAPSGADATITLTEDTTHILTATTFGFNDVDARDSLSAVRIDTLPTAGTLTLSGVAVTAGQVVTVADLAAGNLVFTPAADANGTGYANFTFSVRDSNNAYDAAPNTLTFDVTAVNDAPIRTAGTVSNLTLSEDAGLASLGLGGVSYSPGGGADESGQTLTYAVTVIPSASIGDVFLADGTTRVTVGSYTLAEIQGMQFKPAANASGVTAFQFNVYDSGGTANGGADSISQFILITVTAVNDAPTITNLSGDSLSYSEGDGAVVIEQSGNALVADVDSANLDTGTLTVSIPSGGDSAEDVLSIQNQGTGAGQIGVSGSNVTYQGVTIGTFTGGSGGTNLVITLNASATPAAVTALVKNITYENTDTAAPTTGARTVRYVLTDGDGGTSANYDTTVTVSGVNDAPVNTVPGAQTVNEDTPLSLSGISVNDVDGNLSTVQLAVGNGALNVTLSGGATISAGSNGSTTLTLSGSQTDLNATLATLSYQGNLNFTGADTLTVTSTDANSGSDVDTVAITVTAVNDVPTDLALSANTVSENASNGTVVGTVTGTDIDTGDTKSYSLTNTAGGRFAIDSTTGQLTVANASLLNYEAATSHTVTVRVTDSGGLTYDETFTINLTNINETPTAVTLSSSTVAENSANGTVVGTASTTDVDAGDSHTYQLMSNAGGRFAIDATTGVVTVVDGSLLNYEVATSHTVTIRTMDAGGLTHDQVLSIAVTDVNEATTTPTTVPGPLLPGTPAPPAPPSPPTTGGPVTPAPTEGGAPMPGPAPMPTVLPSDAARVVTPAVAPRVPSGLVSPVGPGHVHGGDKPIVLEEERGLVAWTVVEPVLNLLHEAADQLRTLVQSPEIPVKLSEFIVKELDAMTESLEEAMQGQQDEETLVAVTAAGVSIVLSTGYVVWALRGGWLLASLLATMPAWRSFDPLPVLVHAKEDRERGGKHDGRRTARREDERIEHLFGSNEGRAA